MATQWAPGTIAIDWEERTLLVRSPFPDYWFDSRYPNVGRILMRDETVTPDKYQIFTAKVQ